MPTVPPPPTAIHGWLAAWLAMAAWFKNTGRAGRSVCPCSLVKHVEKYGRGALYADA